MQKNLKIGKASPLFVAASMGHLNSVRYLVDHGADVSAKTGNEANADYDALSPLYGAVSDYCHLKLIAEERSSIFSFLLESGEDPSTDTVRPSDGNPMTYMDEWLMRH